jgi:putative transposase
VQIIAALKQVEAGRTVDDVARECGVSAATIYAWKAKYGGCQRGATAAYLTSVRSRTTEIKLDAWLDDCVE